MLAGSGCYSRFIGTVGQESLDSDFKQMVEAAFRRRKHELPTIVPAFIRTGSGREVVVLLQSERDLSDTDRWLVRTSAAACRSRSTT